MPARRRIDAAKIIVDRAGYVAAPPAPQLYEKELQHMSLAELKSHIKMLEASMKDVTRPPRTTKAPMTRRRMTLRRNLTESRCGERLSPRGTTKRVWRAHWR